jgi:hypothetical protein
MSDPFALERFLPHVGEVFHVVKEDGTQTPVLLSEVTRLASDDSPRRIREPFSLVFHASPETRLEQRIYRVENAGMNPFDCFLVAIGPDAYGMRFEAVYT